MPDCGTHLHELLDCFLYLVVEDTPVGYYNDRVEYLFPVLFHADKLMRKPGNGIRFAAARRVLDQVALSGTAFGAFGEGYLRFSVANSLDNLKQALERVDQWTRKNL